MLKTVLAIVWFAILLFCLGLGLKRLSEHRWFTGRPYVGASLAAIGAFSTFSIAAICAIWAGLASQDASTFWGLQCFAVIMAFVVGAALLTSVRRR